jgi:hypothetical protein
MAITEKEPRSTGMEEEEEESSRKRQEGRTRRCLATQPGSWVRPKRAGVNDIHTIQHQQPRQVRPTRMLSTLNRCPSSLYLMPILPPESHTSHKSEIRIGDVTRAEMPECRLRRRSAMKNRKTRRQTDRHGPSNGIGHSTPRSRAVQRR